MYNYIDILKMENHSLKNINIYQILKWYQNKLVNPISERKIKENGKTYNQLKTKYDSIFPYGYNFFDADSREPVSLANIWEYKNNKKVFIYEDYTNLVLYKDEKNFINCFEKETINRFIKHNIIFHPVTFLEIPKNILQSIEYIENKYNKTIKERTLDIFQIFTKISVFIDFEEFLLLPNMKLDKLYYETHDFFHQNIPDGKISLIKQIGIDKKMNMYNLSTDDFNELSFENKQKNILDSFEILLNFNDDDIKFMSYYIILGGLSLFIPKIKKDYPDFCFSF